jgi:hypothetical protein
MTQPDKLIIEEDESLVRDVKNNAILNRDLSALDKYKQRRNQRWELQQKLEEFDVVKEELSEVKALLHQLLDRVSK